MLDLRTKSVLKFLVAECKEGSYRVIEIKDIKDNIPSKFKADGEMVKGIMEYLSKGSFIDIKYKDSGKYCIMILPLAWQVLENEKNEIKKTKKFIGLGSLAYFLVFIFAFLGSFLAIILYDVMFF